MQTEIFFTALFIAGVQLAAALSWRRRLARPAPGRVGPLPAVSVLTACKGSQEGLEENLRSVLAQDYPAPAEFLIVVPSAADPAHADLTRILASLADPRARLLVSAADPKMMSEQNENLLFALARLDPGSSVLVFADADIRVGPGWLAALAAPLSDPGVGCVTAPALYVPDGGWAGALRTAWIVHGLPYLAALGYASGQSLAVRRADFEGWGVAARYRRSINMDLTLAAAVRERGLRVETAARELPLWVEPCPPAALGRGFNKWLLHFRLYGPAVWALGALSTAAKGLVYLNAGAVPAASLALAGSDALCAWLTARSLETSLGKRLSLVGLPPGRLSLTSAAAAPLLPVLHAVNVVVSAFTSRLLWGARLYRIRGPYAVSVGEPVPPVFTPASAALLVAGAAAYAVSFWPGGPWWLHWFAHVPLLWALRGRDPWPAFLIGWAYGTLAWMVGCPWLAATIARFVNLPPAAGWGPVIVVNAWHGLMWGGAAAAAAFLAAPLGRAWKGREDAALAAAFVPVIVLLDAVFPRFFPVILSGSQAAFPPAVQIAALGGPWAVTAWLAGLNAFVFLGLAQAGHRAAFLTGAGILLAGNLAYGTLSLRAWDAARAERSLRVGLVQTDFQHGLSFPKVDFHPQNLELLVRLGREAAGAGADLVVWPESAYERFLTYRRTRGEPLSPHIDGLPFALAARRDMPVPAPLLANTVGEAMVPTRAGARLRVYNTAFLKMPDGAFGGLVEKSALIPLGEYMPMPRRLGFLRRFSPRTYVFSRGPGGRLLSLPGGERVGALICYEDLFPLLALGYRRAGADVLVNLTNDVWFNTGFARGQHLQFSAMRAVESGLPMLRAVNTGMSASIDAKGRVAGRLGPGEVGTLVVDIPLRKGPPAPMPPWGVPALAGAALLLLCWAAGEGDRWET